jgi:hypothetical protein
MTHYTDTAEILMKEYPTLTPYEALRIALEEERNIILEEALGTRNGQMSPVYLEAIGMALGFKPQH